jgi:hypothetical protein
LKQGFAGQILVPLVRKSSSSFLLLSVAFLAAAASLQSGGAWLGNSHQHFGTETRAAVASLREDVREMRSRAEKMPPELRNFWNDLCRDVRTLEADLAADARSAAARISNLLKNS